MTDRIQKARFPGLKESCRAYVDKPLTLEFCGWAWTQAVDGNYSDYDFKEVMGTTVDVIPAEFFHQKETTTRGFRGSIRSEGHPFNGHYIITGPMVSSSAPSEESCIFDFTDHLSPEWKFWVSETEMTLPTLSYRQLSPFNLISGCCRISEHKD